MSTTPLGPQLSWLASHNGCTFNPDPALAPVGDCGKPPTLHLRLPDGSMIAACTGHRRFALAHLPAIDWHEWEAWCNMPGAIWHPSPTPDEADSWCSLDDSGVTSLRARETLDAEVTA